MDAPDPDELRRFIESKKPQLEFVKGVLGRYLVKERVAHHAHVSLMDITMLNGLPSGLEEKGPESVEWRCAVEDALGKYLDEVPKKELKPEFQGEKDITKRYRQYKLVDVSPTPPLKGRIRLTNDSLRRER